MDGDLGQTSQQEERTTIIVIDALRDFIDPRVGSFGKYFAKMHGEDELTPIAAVMKRIEHMTRATYYVAHNVFCGSRFLENPSDCPFPSNEIVLGCFSPGSQPAIDTRFFDTYIEKPDDFIQHCKDGIRELSQCTRLVIAGVTTTSCVRNAIEGVITGMRDHLLPQLQEVVVPRDVVAARRSREADAQKLLEEWSTKGVHILNSWEDLSWDNDVVERETIWIPKDGPPRKSLAKPIPPHQLTEEYQQTMNKYACP
jgi:nicotinamidase-related amidase